MGQKQKTEKKEERLNDGKNNGQATHGARKPPGPKEERLNDGKNNGQAMHGARKPPGPKKSFKKRLFEPKS